jgi:hypothetical protein
VALPYHFRQSEILVILDWMVRFRRRDLVLVIRDYFDVLWDRADRLLDSGEVTAGCESLLRDAEKRLSVPSV